MPMQGSRCLGEAHAAAAVLMPYRRGTVFAAIAPALEGLGRTCRAWAGAPGQIGMPWSPTSGVSAAMEYGWSTET
jgi:hypothetical protein